MGQGREPWEWSEAGGVNNNEQHLHHFPVLSPTEELRKDKRRSDDSARRERTRPGFFILCYVCGCHLWGAASSLCLFILLLKSLNVCRFPPPSSCIYKLCYIGAETREEGGRNRQTFKDFNNKINKHKRTQTWSSLVLHCRHSSLLSFRSSSVGLETGKWCRCCSLSSTPPASLHSHGSRPRPTRHI